MSKLTKSRVCEVLVHEFMVSPVACQGKGPIRNMLKFFRQVLFIIPLRWLQLSPCKSKWIKTNTEAVTPLVLSWCHASTYAYLYFAPTLFVRPDRS